jgi:23S rRNA (pseudouridine1915-N3)-methyltransferase
MRCTIVAVGRLRDGVARALFDEYARRLTPPIELIEIEDRRKLPEQQLREIEAEQLVQALPKDCWAVLLDEAGRTVSSPEFAQMLGVWQASRSGRTAFMIGGAAGHGSAARTRADFALSFGPMTWPHALVRGLLAEQLYRAHCLLTHHPYHRA